MVKTFQRIAFDLVYQVYALAAKIYNIILEIASMEFMSSETIQQFSDGIKVVLAVIVFFRIAISLLEYLVDPDKMEDTKSGKGTKSLFMGIIVTIGMLMLYSYGFELLRGVQSAIINDDIIFKLFSGSSSNVTGTAGGDTGKKITDELFFNFFYCSNEAPTNAPSNATQKSNNPYYSPDQCNNDIEAARNDDWSGINTMLNRNVTFENLGVTFLWFLSFIFGVVVLLFFISTAIDVGIRGLKLMLLELIAIIPITSYITPKTRGTFDAWIKELGSVYLDLFIRMIALALISFICKSSFWETIKSADFVIKILLIISMLLFMKEVPNFITKSLGIKGGNMKFKMPGQLLKETPILGSALVAGGAITGAALGGASFREVMSAGGSAWRKNGGFASDGNGRNRSPLSPSVIAEQRRSNRRGPSGGTPGGGAPSGGASSGGASSGGAPSGGYHANDAGIFVPNNPPISNPRSVEDSMPAPKRNVDPMSDDYRRARDNYNETRDKFGDYDQRTIDAKTSFDKYNS